MRPLGCLVGPSARRAALIAIGLASWAAIGCRASASAELNAGGEAKSSDAEFEDEAAASSSLSEPEAEPSAEYALLGARHDLRLSPDRKTATCSCVAMAVGAASDTALSWQGPRPNIDPQSQLVIALNSEGIACSDAPKDGLGASYWGYRVSGDDVVVFLEVARFGRPVTTGAIIPKPMGNGQVVVQPVTKDVPYGRPLDASQKVCRLGNPGPRRTSGPAPAPGAEEGGE